MSEANVTIEALEHVRQAMLEFRSDTDAVYTKLRRAIPFIIDRCCNIISDAKMHIEDLQEKINGIKMEISHCKERINELDAEISETEAEISSTEDDKSGYENRMLYSPVTPEDMSRNQSLRSAAAACQAEIDRLEQQRESLLTSVSEEECYLEEKEWELDKVMSELDRAEQHLSGLQSEYSRMHCALSALNSSFSSFVRSADSSTSGNVMALDKCIDAISDYMNT